MIIFSLLKKREKKKKKREQFRMWHATLDKVSAEEIRIPAVRKASPQIRSVID